MTKRKLSLILLLLTFLSGEFTLNRLQLGSDLEIRYIIYALFICSLIIPDKNNSFSVKFKLNNATLIFMITTFAYFFMSLTSVFYSDNQLMALSKLSEVSFLILLTVSTFYIVNKFEWNELIYAVSMFFVIVGLIYSLPIFVSSFIGQGRGEFALGGPNVTTRILFFATISSIYMFITRDKVKYLLLTVLFLGSVVLLGSRGGMLGAAVALLALFVCKKVFKKWEIKKNPVLKVKHFVYTGLGAGALFLIYDRVKDVFLNRVIKLTFGGDQIYTSGRDYRYEMSINMIKDRPIFGHGLNWYDAVTGLGYPHNIMLELMIEIGVFGLFFFIVASLFSVILIFKLKNTPLFVFSVLPLYMIVVHMFSGDIYDFRYFFFWSTLLLHYYKSAIKYEGDDIPTE